MLVFYDTKDRQVEPYTNYAYEHSFLEEHAMKKQVVVVEDDPHIRELIEYILEDHEIEVVSFRNALNFLSASAHIHPDLYLLDIMLPDGNGIELCKELKARKTTRETPIIMMSAHSDQLHPECEAEDFIAKPFDIENLVACVEQYMW